MSGCDLEALNADVCVVGAGVIGLATALALSDEGARVVVLDARQPAGGASWAGGGILSPLPPDRWPDELRPLVEDSLERYPAWCAKLYAASGIDPEYWRCGARQFTGEQVREYPDMAQVRNPRLLRALLEALARRGVVVRGHTPVTGWQRQGTRLTGVRSGTQVLQCAQAVVTAGAWSGQLIEADIRPVKGQMLLFKGEPGVLDHMRIGDHAYVVPRRDGHVLVGSTLEHAGFDTAPTEAARDRLMEQGLALWPQLASLPQVRQWAGLRPHAPGGRPLIGAVAQLAGLYLCAGHFRIGITLAPASAAWIVADMAGHAEPRALPYAPDASIHAIGAGPGAS